MTVKKKVAHLLTSNKYSGAENVALTIIKQIEENANEFELFYVSPIGKIKDICKERDVNYVPLKNFTLSEIKKAMSKIKPDIIHAHDATATVKAVFVAKNAYVISHLHNNNPIMKTKNLKSILYYICLRKVKCILTVSESIMNEFIYADKIKNKVRQVGNPIDFNKIIKYQSEEKNIDILFVGRLVKEKNPVQFIDVCERLIKVNKNIKCMMIGDGELYDKIQSIIIKKNLQNNISMKGFLYQPYKEMASAKILLMTSKWEGYGLVAIESMITGTVVVAPKVGGLIDIIDNRYGFVYTDIDNAITEIIKLLSDDKYYKEKKNIMMTYIQSFNNSKYRNEIVDIYKEVLR